MVKNTPDTPPVSNTEDRKFIKPDEEEEISPTAGSDDDEVSHLVTE